MKGYATAFFWQIVSMLLGLLWFFEDPHSVQVSIFAAATFVISAMIALHRSEHQ